MCTFFKIIISYLKLLVNLFLPKHCCVCGNELLFHENHFCLECYAGLPLTYYWKIKDNPAEVVFFGRSMVERVYCLYYYVNNYRKPVHELKYKSNVQIGHYLGEMLGGKIGESLCPDKFDFIIPVPLHYRKKWKRGYNQSEIICEGISKGLLACKAASAPTHLRILTNLLKRKQFTKTQTEKDRVHRWENVAAAFEVNMRVRDKTYRDTEIHFLLVDDVLTTGATLEACCNILHSNFNCKISVATLAYVE